MIYFCVHLKTNSTEATASVFKGKERYASRMTRTPLLSSYFLSCLVLGACQVEGRMVPAKAQSSSSSVSAIKTGSTSSVRTIGSLFQKRASQRGGTVSVSSASRVAVPPVNKAIPILVYHHVRSTKGMDKSTWTWKMSVAPDVFEKQMKHLKDNGYTAIDLTTYVQIMKGETDGPAKPVVITFDDNQPNQYDVALPLIEKYGHMAVFYMVSNRIGVKGFLSAEQILDMQKRGMDIESHTIAHRVLTALPAAEVERDLAESKKALEDLLGKPVLHVAYPGTAHNQTVRDRAKAAGYVTATIMDPRTATEKDDFYKLPRIMMTDDSNLQKVLP